MHNFGFLTAGTQRINIRSLSAARLSQNINHCCKDRRFGGTPSTIRSEKISSFNLSYLHNNSNNKWVLADRDYPLVGQILHLVLFSATLQISTYHIMWTQNWKLKTLTRSDCWNFSHSVFENHFGIQMWISFSNVKKKINLKRSMLKSRQTHMKNKIFVIIMIMIIINTRV